MKTVYKIYSSDSAEKTQKIGREFAKILKGGTFIAFFGELGGGKTTFIQGLAKGLGIKKRIISPTFIILRQYKIPGKLNNFYHIDLYRINMEESEVSELGMDEIIKEKKDIVAVEWAEKIGDKLPKNRWEVSFEYIDENKRQISIRRIND